MIWERFVASQMAAGPLRSNDRRRRGRRVRLPRDGHASCGLPASRASTKRPKDDEARRAKGRVPRLPELKEGEPLEAASSSRNSTSPSRRRATPKRRWSRRSKRTASGGRRPTRRSSRRFRRAVTSTQQERRFIPTPRSAPRSTISSSSTFQRIVDLDFTAQMEGDLDRIAEGARGLGRAPAAILRPVRERARRGRKEAAAARTARRADRRDLSEVRPPDGHQDRPLRQVHLVQRLSRMQDDQADRQGDGRESVPRTAARSSSAARRRAARFTAARTIRSAISSRGIAVVPEPCPVCGIATSLARRRRARRQRPPRNAPPTVTHDVDCSSADDRIRSYGTLLGLTCERLTVIGGGLAGCEAAWQAARCGVEVDLYEMRPHTQRPGAHDRCARRARLQQLAARRRVRERRRTAQGRAGAARFADRRLGARNRRSRPARALAVDRVRFSALVESRIAAEPRIRAPSRRDAGDSARPPGDRRLRAAAVADVLRKPRSSSWWRARSRRLHYSMRRRRSSRPTRSTSRRCTESRATIRATATTISTFRSIAKRYARLRRAILRTLRRHPDEGFRGAALFRRLPAGRRDGGARRRRAALRAAASR